MKKICEEPKLEIIELPTIDFVVTSSGQGTGEGGETYSMLSIGNEVYIVP